MERSIMTADDLNRTYTDTYLSFRTRDDEGFYPAKVLHSQNRRGDTPTLLVEKLNGDKLILPIYDKRVVEVNYSWPRLGAINTKNGVEVVTRKAARQWKRGLRPSLIDIMNLSAAGTLRISRSNQLPKELLKNLFNPKYYTLAQANTMLENQQRTTVAISPQFSVGVINRAKVIFFGKLLVGTYDDDLSIHLQEKAQNLEPFLRREIT